MISAVIITFNEADKLKKCLSSLEGFADEKVIVDLGSKDQTKELAEKYNAKFFTHRYVEIVELVRNFAISKASGNWILVLDPDEFITKALAEKLKEVMLADDYCAVNIPRKNVFFGHWIAHTNWWPDRHVRFFKKGSVNWDAIIHSYPKVVGNVFNMPSQEKLAIVHYGYDNFSQFLERQNRYSGIEAKEKFDKGERFSWMAFFWKPTREFLVRFIRHFGFLDGFYGFSLTFLMMVYQIVILVKIWELQKRHQ